jgi:hypothetical protein
VPGPSFMQWLWLPATMPLTAMAPAAARTWRAGSMARGYGLAAAVYAARSDGSRGCRRYLRLHWFHLLLMLARQVLGTVHNDQEDRHHAPQR